VRKQNHDRRADAERALAMVKADLHRGVDLDPAAGRVTLGDYAAAWRAAQTFDETTREAVALRLRPHVLPELGGYPLAALRPSVVQAWARGLQTQLAPSYVRVVFANLSAMLQAAVDDGAIARNPCRVGVVKPPAPDCRKVLPAVAEYLGHNDPGFTLRVYAHLMPSSEARARTAVDRALGGAMVAGPRALDVPSVGGERPIDAGRRAVALDVVEVYGRRADLRPVLGTQADQEGRYSTLVITGQAR
jgi:hypothetical protein